MDDSESIEEPPIPFIVDRPFVSVIRDTATGAILFVGQITDPSAAESRAQHATVPERVEPTSASREDGRGVTELVRS
jgi:hypothetical protein